MVALGEVLPKGQLFCPFFEQAWNHCALVVLAATRSVAPPVLAPHMRLPAHLQYAYASHQSTSRIGSFSSPACVTFANHEVHPAVAPKVVFHWHLASCPIAMVSSAA